MKKLATNNGLLPFLFIAIAFIVSSWTGHPKKRETKDVKHVTTEGKRKTAASKVILTDSASIEQKINELVPQLTLEEKAGLVAGIGRRGFQANSTTGANAVKVPGAAGFTMALPRLNITSIVLSDGPAGVRILPFRNNDSSTSYYCTAFPVATLLASTWDTAMVRKTGNAFGNEVREYGIDVLLAPALNIHRNPLGGRNFEYYSEDPLVAGRITAAMVKGIQANGVGTSIKHFAANNQETNRNSVNTIASERALREIYLKGFEIAVKEANPWTVMSSYNKINGTYTSESGDLLTTILRNEWGFKGLVMTDWFGGKDPVAQMKAGNDLLMPGSADQSKKILEAVKNGTLDTKVLDENVKRVLRLVLRSPGSSNYAYSNKPDLAAHALISKEAAEDGMVLLKNEGKALPIKNTSKKVAVFGNTSYDIIAGGTGSGDVNKAYTISLIQGLKNAGFVPSESLQKSYEQYIADAKAKRPKPRRFFDPIVPIPEMNIEQDMIAKEAAGADIGIITIGRSSGEGSDRKVDSDFNFIAAEKDLISHVSDAFHAKGKKVIVVLNIGGVIEVASWRNSPDAILLAWQPGQEAGNAIMDILTGKANPSGKLATSFPMDYNDVPSAKNFPGNPPINPTDVTYQEGIYVGYRYYEHKNVNTAYEFGYGISYTTFTYGIPKLDNKQFSGKQTVSLDITNTGPVAGKEVVELYVSAPAKELDKPLKELKAFVKTKLLQPGEKQTVSFVLDARDLASFDTGKSAWVTEPGNYSIQIGSSSKNIKQTVSFQIPKEIVVEKVNKALAPQADIQELK